MTTYYQASYLPPGNEYDGKFHAVVAKPLRAGLRIRTETGYLALPARLEDGSRPQLFEIPLLRLLKQSPLPAEVAFRAQILNMGNHAEGNASALAIEIPLDSLEIRKDSNTPTYTAHLSMIANIRDQAGALFEHFSADAPQRGTLSTPEMKSAEVISLQRHFVAPAGSYVLEAAIMDLNSGMAGAQRIPFEISAETAVPSLSKLVLVRRTDPLGTDEDTGDPLRQGTNRVTPNLFGSIPPGVHDIAVFFAAHADPHATGKAKLEIQVLRDGKPMGGGPVSDQQVGGTEYSSYLSSFTIDPPRDGEYQVKVVLSQDGKMAEADASFAMTSNAGSGEGEDAPDPRSGDRPTGPLKITFPDNAIQRPAAEELKSLIADATHYAMDYRDSLPNFICEEVTDRSISFDGAKTWKHKDKVTGLLTFFDHAEDWSFLETEQDGHRNQVDDETASEKGISTAGLFGSVITGLFRPLSKAEIAWKETGVLGDGTVQVFSYRVARENSNLNLRVSSNEVITVGYHGVVYIDSATHSVRRITEVADDVPKKYPVRGASVTADYDFVSIGGRDYLMPVGAQVILQKSHHETDLNEMGFRDFHRFGSTMRILASPAEKAQ